MLTVASFEQQAETFAARSASRGLSWAFVKAAENGPKLFLRPQPAYLRSSPLVLPPSALPPAVRAAVIKQHGGTQWSAATSPASAPKAERDEPEASLLGGAEDDGTLTLEPAPQACWLDLHIIFSETYQVPVLLIQGRHPEGEPWAPSTLRAFLSSRDDGSGHAPLAGSVVTQHEHPVLHMPFCCIDPCETSALMRLMLAEGGATAVDASESVTSSASRLDYLSAWWSVLAPCVGAECRGAWFTVSQPEEERPPSSATASAGGTSRDWEASNNYTYRAESVSV